MCTVSWLPGPGGYLLCFSRDENRARQPGLPPTIRTTNSLDIIAPTDADAGGTWIGVNSAGVTVCLANLYEHPGVAPLDPISRGQLVLGLLGLPNLESVASAFEMREHTRFRPFTLIAIAPRNPARIWQWDGQEVSQREQTAAGLLVTSSAVDQAGAAASREGQFAALFASSELSVASLTDLHRSHRPARGGLSVCMHRNDAQTVSLATVEVTTDVIAMAYSAGSPCHTPLATPLKAMRRGLRTNA